MDLTRGREQIRAYAILVYMMKRIPALLIISLLAACSTYEVKDAGDGVYYAESPPEYSYVYNYSWPSWYSRTYYPFYSTCWYGGHYSRHCGWHGPPYLRYSYYPPRYYGDFAVSDKYPGDESGERKSRKKRVIQPLDPEKKLSPAFADIKSIKYATSHKTQGAKAIPGKSSVPSTTSAFGKRTMKAPKQSYSRPTRSRSVVKTKSAPKVSASRKLD